MIIDLTELFNAVHHIWDGLGVIFGLMLLVFVPIIVFAAASIKVGEYLSLKKENK